MSEDSRPKDDRPRNDGGQGGGNQRRRRRRRKRGKGRSPRPEDAAGDDAAAGGGEPPESAEPVEGLLVLAKDGFGFLRQRRNSYLSGSGDIYVPANLIKRLHLRPGQYDWSPGHIN